MVKCPEYARLSAEVENILGNLAQVTTLLLELFRARNWMVSIASIKNWNSLLARKNVVLAPCAST